MQDNTNVKSNRIFYYDFLRVICFLMIIYYHLTIHLNNLGITTSDVFTQTYQNANTHIAKIAVSVFFMLSGACLSLSDKFSLTSFMKKRVTRILIPFYFSVILFYIYYYLNYKVSFLSTITGLARRWYAYTILGVDEWLSMHDIDTFSCGIGEWFLGLLIVFYLLYPLLRKIIFKWPRIFFIIATVIYVIIAINYERWFGDYVLVHMSMFLKLYEFIIGIYFGRYFKTFPKAVRYGAIPLFLFWVVFPIKIDIPEGFINTIVATLFFISFSCFEDILKKAHKFTAVIALLGSFSYEVFLVHSKVIYEFQKNVMLGKPDMSNLKIGAGVILQIVIFVALGIIVKFLSDKSISLVGLINKKISKKRRCNNG